MKVICVFNKPSVEEGQVFLTVGKEYNVYAIIFWNNKISYGVKDDTERSYFMFYEATHFSVEDYRLSKYWIYNYNTNKNFAVFGFKEYVLDNNFFENLVNNSSKEVNIFNKYKAAIDFEFPDSSKKNSVNLNDDGWVMCPECCEGWQPKRTAGLIQCPKCLTVSNNPFYQASFCD